MSQTLQVGQPSPDFSAPVAFPGESTGSSVRTASLAYYRDRWLVFFWYSLDFTFVCSTETKTAKRELCFEECNPIPENCFPCV